MAYIQRNIPPPNKINTFSLKNFVGGLNNHSEVLVDNEASDVMNMMFSDDTIMENRYGQKYYDNVSITSNESLVFIDEYKPYDDDNQLIRSSSKHMFSGDGLLRVIDGIPSGVNHSGKYFFTDGDKLFVYGKFPLTSSTYVTVIGTPVAPILDGYVWLEIASPSDGHARLGTEHTQGVLNVDYTGRKIYYEPCENEFVDAYKGANKVPANVHYIVSHNGRLFVSGAINDDDNVFITSIQNPYYFPVSLPIQLPPNSDKIIGMCVYDNSVVVGRHDDLHAIFGSTNNPALGVDVFQLRRINSHTGFVNNSCANIAHNYLFFLGNDGNAYSLSSTRNNDKVLATTVLTKDIDIIKHPINISLSDLSIASSIFFNDEWLVSIKDKVLVYSYKLQKWTVYNNMNARSFYNLNRELIWGRPDGKTAMFDKVNYLDFGVPYKSYWHSKRFDMDNANSYKQFREFFLVAHTFEDYPSDINILFEVDYDDVKDRIIVHNQISTWGNMQWGDRFITRNINESIPLIIGRRGRSIKFKISCGYDKHGSVTNYSDLATYLGKADGVLVYVTGTSKYYLYMNNVWIEQTTAMLNQRMKIYQINGDYELRGKR